MQFRFFTADIFTDHAFGGNQLAVLPDARGLKAAQMQQIAREFNLSETVFVFPPDDPANTRRLRIFTPGAEVPFAGHPTIGTACVLAAGGDIGLNGETTDIVFEEGVGPVAVRISAVAGQPRSAELTAAQMPETGPKPPLVSDLAAMLSVDVDDIDDGEYAPQAVSCGVPFLYITIRSLDAMARLHLDMTRWRQLLADYWAPTIYCIALVAERPDSDIRARMFAPAFGIAEDPATGAAAAALAGYLGSRESRANGTLHWVVEQGFEMGRPSILRVSADKQGGQLTAIRVAGDYVPVSEGVINISCARPE